MGGGGAIFPHTPIKNRNIPDLHDKMGGRQQLFTIRPFYHGFCQKNGRMEKKFFPSPRIMVSGA